MWCSPNLMPVGLDHSWISDHLSGTHQGVIKADIFEIIQSQQAWLSKSFQVHTGRREFMTVSGRGAWVIPVL